MKKKYFSPKLEINRFSTEDIITASNVTGGNTTTEDDTSTVTNNGNIPYIIDFNTEL